MCKSTQVLSMGMLELLSLRRVCRYFDKAYLFPDCGKLTGMSFIQLLLTAC